MATSSVAGNDLSIQFMTSNVFVEGRRFQVWVNSTVGTKSTVRVSVEFLMDFRSQIFFVFLDIVVVTFFRCVELIFKFFYSDG